MQAQLQQATVVDKETWIDVVQVGILGLTPLLSGRIANSGVIECFRRRNTVRVGNVVIIDDPIEDYRESVYKMPDGSPTLLGFSASAYWLPTMRAGERLNEVPPARLKRCVRFGRELLPLYGLPRIHISFAKWDDRLYVRSRAIFPRWGMRLNVQALQQLVSVGTAIRALSEAGRSVGIGLFCPWAGGDFGTFEVVAPDDPRLLELIEQSTAEAQAAALATPEPFDGLAREVLAAYSLATRGNR
jgi:hypothetical protein